MPKQLPCYPTCPAVSRQSRMQGISPARQIGGTGRFLREHDRIVANSPIIRQWDDTQSTQTH